MSSYIESKLKSVKRKIASRIWEYKFNRLRRKAFVPFDKGWFKGKRVAVIGGADSAYVDKVGDYIDGFDVVIRINNGVGMIDEYKEYVGTKTDFLFHCLFANPSGVDRNPITLDLWREKNVGLLVSCHNDLISGYGKNNVFRFLRLSRGGMKYSSVSPELHRQNLEVLKPHSPTTGFIVINTIMACEPKELYVTGITFFRTPYFDGYRQDSLEFCFDSFKKFNTHDPSKEYQLVREIYKKSNGKLIPDSTLAGFYAEDDMIERRQSQGNNASDA